ncbi:MAG: potassium channel family protein [Casimicrobiaceae bacterium]
MHTPHLHTPHPHRDLQRLWASDWSLTALLALLLVMLFVLQPMIELGYHVAIVGSAAFSLMLVSGFFAVAHTRAMRWLLGTGVLVTLALHWARYTIAADQAVQADSLVTLAASGLLAGIVFVHVFRPGPITVLRIQGAMAGYLLIAIMFAAAYNWIDINSPNAFVGAVAPATVLDQRAARFGYFSFVTLTTVGYGDIVPVQPFARSLAMLEAFIGQIFPAILLARLVSMEIAERQGRSHTA